MTRCSLTNLSILAMFLVALSCEGSAQAAKYITLEQMQAKHTLQHYIELRLQNADWKEYSRYITWPDEPGWDCKWIVERYRVGVAISKGEKIVIPVVSNRLGLFCSDFDFKLDRKSITIRYELVRGPRSWKVNAPIPDYPEIGTKAVLELLRNISGNEQEEPERRAEATRAARELEAALKR